MVLEAQVDNHHSIDQKVKADIVFSEAGMMGCKKPAMWIKYGGNHYTKVATFVSEERMYELIDVIKWKFINEEILQ